MIQYMLEIYSKRKTKNKTNLLYSMISITLKTEYYGNTFFPRGKKKEIILYTADDESKKFATREALFLVSMLV